MALSCLFMAPRLETLVRTCVDALTVSVGVGLELGWCLLWPLCGSALSAWTGRRGEQGLDSAYSFCRAPRCSGRCLCTGTLRKRFATGPDGRSQYLPVGPMPARWQTMPCVNSSPSHVRLMQNCGSAVRNGSCRLTRAVCALPRGRLHYWFGKKRARILACRFSRSNRVRKSIVLNSRSIAGGPQILAPMAR
jgi:hypothetical protein